MSQTIALVLQLFFTDGQQVRAEIPMSSLEECFDAAHQAINIRQHQGKPVVAVAVTCFVPVEPKNPA